MDDVKDYSRSFGGAALAARLRRLSEHLDREGTLVYAARNIRFEQRWYGILRQLIANGPMAIGEIATVIRITHASVSEASRSMEKAGIIVSSTSAEDGRKRVIGLTRKGHALARELTPVWEAFNAAALELNEEAGDVVGRLDALEDALAARSMFDRITDRLGDEEPDPH